MATTPPEQPSRPGYGYHPGATLDWTHVMPLPFNPEFIVFAVTQVVVGLAVLISDQVKGGAWLTSATVLTAAYLISRGIAKASRVLEQ